MTRTTRYALVNGLLYEAQCAGKPISGHDRMYAAELDRFELYCPDADAFFADGAGDDFRLRVLREWRENGDLNASVEATVANFRSHYRQ
jgi:hypothetical protein